jgi:hypothetical protein
VPSVTLFGGVTASAWRGTETPENARVEATTDITAIRRVNVAAKTDSAVSLE